jgi:hypothetical protein
MPDTELSPWHFSNDARQLYAPDGFQRLEYGGLYEKCQGGPLSGRCFWVTQSSQRVPLPGFFGGPPVWEPAGHRVAVPLWNRAALAGSDQHLAVLDTRLRKLLVFRSGFRLLALHSFNNLLITGIDSPIHTPGNVLFNLGTEAIKRVFEL